MTTWTYNCNFGNNDFRKREEFFYAKKFVDSF